MNEKKRVLILCTGNSARSQMAEGLLRELGEGKCAVESAGVAPSSVRREAVEATTRDEVISYLEQYEERYKLPVVRPVTVRAVRREKENFVVETSLGALTAREIRERR